MEAFSSDGAASGKMPPRLQADGPAQHSRITAAEFTAGGGEVFKSVAARLREQRRWCGDHTTFTALGLDVVPSSGRGGSARLMGRMQAVDLGASLRLSPLSDKAPCKASVRSVDTALPSSDAEGPCDSDSGSYATDTSSGEQTADGTSNFIQVRTLLLSFRSARASPPPELMGFFSTAEETEKAPRAPLTPQRSPHGMAFQGPLKSPTERSQPPGTFDCASPALRSGAGSSSCDGRRKRGGRGRGGEGGGAGPAPTQAWHAPSQGQDEELRRGVQSLLNKVCPENVATILQRIAALDLKEARHLEILVELIFAKALAEPHYCETYADLVFGLQGSLPEIAPQSGSGPSLTLRTALLSVCQREFEGMLASMDLVDEEATHGQEEAELLRKQRRERLRANVRLIGHLFLRKLLATKVVGRLACELTGSDNEEAIPEEHAIECACELLLSVGYTLEAHPAGAELVERVCQRLRRLASAVVDGASTSTPSSAQPGRRGASGKRGVYCKRVQFTIQDLLETREAGWSKRSFKSAAKTLEEVRQQQARELSAKSPTGGGDETPGAEQVVVGLRPAYLSAMVACN